MKMELKFKIIIVCILAAIAIAANVYEDYMVYGDIKLRNVVSV